MSATVPTAAAASPLPAPAPTPFSRLLQVEFRKSWDTRSSFWLLFAVGAIVVVAELIAAIVTGVNDADIAFGDFAGVAGFVTQFVLPVIGIMLVSAEWGQRTAMVSFALEPRRSRVIWAKLCVSLIWAALTVVFALAMGVVFNLLYGAVAGHIDWSGGEGVFGFTITQVFAMLLGFAFAALFLNTAGAIVAYYAFLFAIPTVLAIGSGLMDWFKSFAEWINFSQAENRLISDPGVLHMSGSEWGKLIVSGLIWLGLPLVFGLRRIMRAEVK